MTEIIHGLLHFPESGTIRHFFIDFLQDSMKQFACALFLTTINHSMETSNANMFTTIYELSSLLQEKHTFSNLKKKI